MLWTKVACFPKDVRKERHKQICHLSQLSFDKSVILLDFQSDSRWAESRWADFSEF